MRGSERRGEGIEEINRQTQVSWYLDFLKKSEAIMAKCENV